MAHDVFISHSTNDRTVANAVCAMLERASVRCWIAPRDVTPGKSWGGEIMRAIAETKIMVLIFSGQANSSPQILREVERAVGRRVVILPFKVEDVAPADDLEYFISSQHWLDAVTPPMEQHIEYLTRTVKRVLEESAAAPVQPDRDVALEGPGKPEAAAGGSGRRGSEQDRVDRDHDYHGKLEEHRLAQEAVAYGAFDGSDHVQAKPSARRPAWLVPGIAVVVLAVLVAGSVMIFGGEPAGEGDDSAQSVASVEAELANVELQRQAAAARKAQTDPTAYLAADSMLAAARARLAALGATPLPEPLRARAAQLDTSISLGRDSLRRGCRAERSVGMDVRCPD